MVLGWIQQFFFDQFRDVTKFIIKYNYAQFYHYFKNLIFVRLQITPSNRWLIQV
jgi:hypothetical protein